MIREKAKFKLLFGLIVFLSASLWADVNTSKLIWSGLNPYHQPFSTTYYYGSGDIDLDGDVDGQDINMVYNIYQGNQSPCIMADVNGNGEVDYNDYYLVYRAVHYNEKLPGWWNALTTRAEREEWLTKMLSIDLTDENRYVDDYVCGDFAAETYYHFTGYRWDSTRFQEYSGGQVIFNMPVYMVTMTGPSFGHSINAILVGDDPLNIDDWYIFEPQSDGKVNVLNYQVVDSIRISSIINTGLSGRSGNQILRYSKEGYNINLLESNPDLLLTRPEAESTSILNPEDRLAPQIISDKYILFEQLRKDMSRTTDIHLGSLPYSSTDNSIAMTDDRFFSKIVDSAIDSKGMLHLVWRGSYAVFNSSNYQTERHFGCYYGVYNLETKTMTEKTWIGDYNSAQFNAKLLLTSQDKIHLIIHGFYDKQIIWRAKEGLSWSNPVILAENIGRASVYSLKPFSRVENAFYSLDAAITKNDNIQISWITWDGDQNTINFKEYDSAYSEWGQTEAIYSNTGYDKPIGLAMANDGYNTLLSFWDFQGSVNQSSGGMLYSMTRYSSGWSSPRCLDSDLDNNTPRIETNGRGLSIMVWNKLNSDSSDIVYRLHINNYNWQPRKTIALEDGDYGFYPEACFTENGNILVCWANCNEDSINIGTETIYQKPGSPVLYYNFDQLTADDESGYNNDGSFEGSLPPQSVSGKRNNGTAFSGDQYIEVPSSNSLNMGKGDFAISCWLKVPASTTALTRILYKKGFTLNTFTGYHLELYQGIPRLSIEDSETNGAVYYYDNNIRLNDDQWHYLTVNFDRDSAQGVQFFIDGQLRYTGNPLTRTGDLNNDSPLLIGATYATDSNKYVGAIDELRIYNRTLLSEEIQNLNEDFYNSLSFTFDGNSLKDVSGNGNGGNDGLGRYFQGINNSAYNFNDENEIIVPDHPSLNFGTGSFSVSFWMKKSTGFDVQYLLDKRDRSVTGYPGFSVYVTDRGNTPTINFSIGNRSAGKPFTTLLNDQWHHIVYVFDRGASQYLSLYIDGSRKFRLSFETETSASNSLDLLIGKNYTNALYDYTGGMDELNFYNKALNTTEILALYNNP